MLSSSVTPMSNHLKMIPDIGCDVITGCTVVLGAGYHAKPGLAKVAAR